ncbi:MAG: hypothetical protein II695_12930 [Oscillospiraceae bacterium]|nr:hypothetical protein [Oscillospiraceae bacterium]
MRFRRFACMILCALSLFVCSAGVSASMYESVTAEIEVVTEPLKNRFDTILHKYDLRIYPEETIAPLPNVDQLILYEHSTGAFSIVLDEPGTYHYRIYEKSGDDPQIKYDDRIYIATVYVEADSNDRLSTAVAVRLLNGDKPDQVVFNDDPASTPSPQPPNPPTPHPVDPSEPTEPTTPVVPVKPSEPVTPPEDPSSGAGEYGDGIFIDVGTFVKYITVPETEDEIKAVEKLEKSFLGNIPVIYIAALIICLAGLAILHRQKDS